MFWYVTTGVTKSIFIKQQHFLGDTINPDIGHNVENFVYLELLRRDYQINIGKANNTEIDFVVRKTNGEQEYIQVACSLISNIFRFILLNALITKIQCTCEKHILLLSYL